MLSVMSEARRVPELGERIPLLDEEGDALYTVIARRPHPNGVELELEHVRTGDIIYRVV